LSITSIVEISGFLSWTGVRIGTRKLERLDENIGAVAVELTPDDLRDIESATSKITVQGARYPESLEKLSER
jgi:diketogulonate reductase-like aldo/keto reductase